MNQGNWYHFGFIMIIIFCLWQMACTLHGNMGVIVYEKCPLKKELVNSLVLGAIPMTVYKHSGIVQPQLCYKRSFRDVYGVASIQEV